jgi:SAM-dependent methyltransferase
MHPQFLDLLCCPVTGEALTLEAVQTAPNGMIIEGALVSASGKRYPIVRGVPRFVGAEQYAASFGYEWTRFPRVQFEDENVGRPLAGHTTRMWETITEMADKRLDGQTVVEFGCGPGRFLDIVRRKGGRAVGIDLSMAVDAARRNFPDDPDVLIVQGDILTPPFREGVFEGGYTIGVLHHTPDPLKGLKALARTIKANGWVACVVYPNRGFYAYRSVARHRALNKRLKPLLGYRFAMAYSYFSAYVQAPLFKGLWRWHPGRHLVQYLEMNWLPTLHDLPDVRWRLLDTFDGVTPAIATTHSGAEVMAWMQAAGCEHAHATGWGETAVIGIRSAKST